MVATTQNASFALNFRLSQTSGKPSAASTPKASVTVVATATLCTPSTSPETSRNSSSPGCTTSTRSTARPAASAAPLVKEVNEAKVLSDVAAEAARDATETPNEATIENVTEEVAAETEVKVRAGSASMVIAIVIVNEDVTEVTDRGKSAVTETGTETGIGTARNIDERGAHHQTGKRVVRKKTLESEWSG